jgi:gluconolactonase
MRFDQFAEIIDTELFTELPQELRSSHHGIKRHGVLEGPSFDKAGNLYCVDMFAGRICRVSPKGEWEIVLEYEGLPNGLKIHRDGMIFVVDREIGLFNFDPANPKVNIILQGPKKGERFLGLNDLVFASNGDIYFTDQGTTGLQNPSGRVYRYTASGSLQRIIDTAPSPNGLVLSRREDALYLAVTRANAIWRIDLDEHSQYRAGLFVQMPSAGPDGLALDVEGNVIVAHPTAGCVRVYSKYADELYIIRTCKGRGTVNIAYGGEDMKTLYILDQGTGSIMTARLPVAGVPMFSHA